MWERIKTIFAPAIELETFPEHDEKWSLYFSVRKPWLRRWLRKHSDGMSIKRFLDSYTWDLTYLLLLEAQSDRRAEVVLLGETD